MFEVSYQIHFDGGPIEGQVVDEVSSVQTWEQVPLVIPEFNFQLGNTSVQMIIDWRNTVEYMKIATRRTLKYYLDGTMPEWPSHFFIDGENEAGDYEPSLMISCRVQASSDEVDTDYCLKFLLYQLFLALNLSSPGCCDFYTTRFCKNNSKMTETFSLSSYSFGAAYDLGCEQGWPVISPIPLSKTWTWLLKLIPEPHPIAQTRTEKALFALLHVCGTASRMPVPTDMIWLAHALEAIFDTPGTGITKALRDRIFLTLNKPDSHSKKIRKSINTFYEFRSAFVHGEFNIAHPLESNEAEQIAGRVIEQSNFATALILASLQKLVKNDWREFEYSESFSGSNF